MEMLGHLLVVDDESAIAKHLKNHLEERHYHVSLAESGEQALEILLRESVNILITDLQMPGMNGLELMGHAKSLQPEIQCVIITGHGDIDTAIEAIQHGAINYLPKPMSLEELDITIEHGMEKIWQGQESKDKQGELEWRNIQLHQEIVERKRLADERRQLEARILKAQKIESLGVMAGGIAHEFNNLLTCIIGFSELASLKLPPDTSCQGHLQQVLRAARRAARLTKQMLDYSGKGKMLVTPVNLSHILGGMSATIAAALPEGIKMQMQLTENLPPIEADINQLNQLIMNLVTNAGESFPGTEGTVTVETGLTKDSEHSPFPAASDESPPDLYIYLKIIDTGCGMSEETKSKIFDPFFSTKFQGRGLGMAASLGIVRGHDGAITVDSTPAQGTTVTVIFPCRLQHQAQPQPPSEDNLAAPAKTNILVVDSDPFMRESMSTMLAKHGFTIFTAKDGQEGIELFHQHAEEIDVILLDMAMPHRSGQKAFKQLRQIKPEVQIILNNDIGEERSGRKAAKPPLALLPKNGSRPAAPRAGVELH